MPGQSSSCRSLLNSRYVSCCSLLRTRALAEYNADFGPQEDVYEEMYKSLSPYRRLVWDAANDICVASFPKTGDEAESQIAEALLKALPSDATYFYVGFSSEVRSDSEQVTAYL